MDNSEQQTPAQDSSTCGPDAWTCKAWAQQFKNISLNNKEASRFGQAAHRRALAHGVEPGKTIDPLNTRFGAINTYPADFLADVWADPFTGA